jgi:hypothetical protein
MANASTKTGSCRYEKDLRLKIVFNPVKIGTKIRIEGELGRLKRLLTKKARGLNPYMRSHPNPCSCCQVSPDNSSLAGFFANSFKMRLNGKYFRANGNFFGLNGKKIFAVCGFVYICIIKKECSNALFP